MPRKSLHAKLEPNVHNRLKTTAAAHGVTISALVESILTSRQTTDDEITRARRIMTDRAQWRTSS